MRQPRRIKDGCSGPQPAGQQIIRRSQRQGAKGDQACHATAQHQLPINLDNPALESNQDLMRVQDETKKRARPAAALLPSSQGLGKEPISQTVAS
jgi:hypothetical protein